MLKLYGVAISNFYNMVHHALLVKGIEHEEVMAAPSQEPEYLEKSPMGKIPCLETEFGFLAESDVILDYLEDIKPEPAMYPDDAFARARVRQIMKMTELYVEAPARRHVMHVVFGGELSQAAYDEVKPAVEKGLNALKRILPLSPYVAGGEFTFADIFLLYSFNLAGTLMQAVYQWDILVEIPGLAESLDLTRDTEIGKRIAAEHEQSLAAMRARNE